MSYKSIIGENQQWIDEVWSKLDEKLSRTALTSYDKIPYTTYEGIHDSRTEGMRITWWTNGFWGGLMWLMYAGTEKECYKATAQKAEATMDEAFNYVHNLHHDVGFMWHIMSGAAYQLTEDKKSKNRNLLAAQILMGRYNVDGDYLVAWNGVDKAGWTIIDGLFMGLFFPIFIPAKKNIWRQQRKSLTTLSEMLQRQNGYHWLIFVLQKNLFATTQLLERLLLVA